MALTVYGDAKTHQGHVAILRSAPPSATPSKSHDSTTHEKKEELDGGEGSRPYVLDLVGKGEEMVPDEDGPASDWMQKAKAVGDGDDPEH